MRIMPHRVFDRNLKWFSDRFADGLFNLIYIDVVPEVACCKTTHHQISIRCCRLRAAISVSDWPWYGSRGLGSYF